METWNGVYQLESELKWEPAGEGVVRQIMGSVGMMHKHYHSQATYVASGKFELTIGDEKKVLGAGDGYYVAPDVLHGCVCLEEGILIDTFSPHRADFVK